MVPKPIIFFRILYHLYLWDVYLPGLNGLFSDSPFPSLTPTSLHQDPYTFWLEILKWVKKEYCWRLMDREQIRDPWKVVPSFLVFTGAREWRKTDSFLSFSMALSFICLVLICSQKINNNNNNNKNHILASSDVSQFSSNTFWNQGGILRVQLSTLVFGVNQSFSMFLYC